MNRYLPRTGFGFLGTVAVLGLAGMALQPSQFGLMASAHAAQPINVAQIVPLSGPLANVGKEIVAITSATIDDFNKKFPDTPVRLSSLDDSNDPAKSTALATQAVPSVNALLSCFGSVSCMAQHKVATASSTPLVGPIAGAEEFRGKGAGSTFAVRASAADELNSLLSFASNLGMSPVSVLVQADGFGNSYLAELDKLTGKFPQLKFTRAAFNPDKPDYGKAADELLAAKPKSLILLANAAHSASFLEAWRKKTGLPFVLNLAGQANSLFASKMKGYVGTAAFVTVTPSPWETKLEVQREYQRVAKAAGVSPSYLGFETYLNTRVFLEGVKHGKAGRKADMLAWLKEQSQLDLGGYTVNYVGSHAGSRFTDLSLLKPDGTYRH